MRFPPETSLTTASEHGTKPEMQKKLSDVGEMNHRQRTTSGADVDLSHQIRKRQKPTLLASVALSKSYLLTEKKNSVYRVEVGCKSFHSNGVPLVCH